jgi:hypothetical protein
VVLCPVVVVLCPVTVSDIFIVKKLDFFTCTWINLLDRVHKSEIFTMIHTTNFDMHTYSKSYQKYVKVAIDRILTLVVLCPVVVVLCPVTVSDIFIVKKLDFFQHNSKKQRRFHWLAMDS